MNFFDDLINYSQTFEDHLMHIAKALSIVIEDNLVLSLKKAKMFYNEVEVLGKMIGVEGIWPIASRIQAIVDLPYPKTFTSLRSLLGMANQYRSAI